MIYSHRGAATVRSPLVGVELAPTYRTFEGPLGTQGPPPGRLLS